LSRNRACSIAFLFSRLNVQSLGEESQLQCTSECQKGTKKQTGNLKSIRYSHLTPCISNAPNAVPLYFRKGLHSVSMPGRSIRFRSRTFRRRWIWDFRFPSKIDVWTFLHECCMGVTHFDGIIKHGILH
jgi:hypothetical protein